MVLFCGVVLFILVHPLLKIRFASVPVGWLLSLQRCAVVVAVVVVDMFVVGRLAMRRCLCIALPREPSGREF